MRYPVMQAQPQYVYKAAVPDGGIMPNSSVRDENRLCESENIWFLDGLLCTRPGLAIDSDKPVYRSDYTNIVSRPLTFTGARVTVNGEEKEIAYLIVTDGVSQVIVHVYLIGKEKELTDIGSMTFNRISSDDFYIPEKLLFFSAGATYGCGIYAFVTVRSGEDTNHVIFECAADRGSWRRLYTDDYYIPTIYINGRGTLFDEVYDAFPDEPIELEQQNLLTGSFKAYFTSDGHSSTFQLPLSRLDNDNVKCRVYSTPTKYWEWMIFQGETSTAIDFYGTQVTLTCDRETGTLHFTSSTGDQPIMKMSQYRGNNIVITASKTIENGHETVVGATRCENFNSFVVLCGSDADKNAVTAARVSRPLYFPKGDMIHVGSSENAVSAVKAFGNRLLCFKTDGIYRIRMTDGSTYSDNEILIGAGSEFYKSDTVKNELLHSYHGCRYADSICLCGNDLVWMDTSRNICVMGTNSSLIYTVSDAISELLDGIDASEYENAKVCFYNGCYMMWLGNRVLVGKIGADAQKTAWYIWKFSDDITVDGVAVLGGVLRTAVCLSYYQRSYPAMLAGTQDILPNSSGETVKSDISAFFTTARYDFGCPQSRKAIDTVFIEAAAPEYIEVSFGNDGSFRRIDIMMDEERAKRRQTASFRIRPGLYGVTGLSLTVRSNTAFSAGDLMFCYRKLSEASGI